MADPTPVVPTLSADSYLRDPVRIIVYQLNFYFSAPKSAMITWFNETASFQRTLARFRNAQDEMLPNAIASELTAMFTRIFGASANVEVSLHPGADDTQRTLRISVSVVSEGRPYALDHNVVLSADGRISYAVTGEDDDEVLTP